MTPKIPKKYQPKSIKILYEDRDLVIGDKIAGFLSVGAKFDRVNTIHHALNMYVRKGSAHSHKCVYVVHRLDQATSGIIVFAKSETAQIFLKDNWKNAQKIYYAVVIGTLKEKEGVLSSYLVEDDDYVVHSTPDKSEGKLAQSRYTVVKETPKHTLVKIELLTGRKNQIRVQFADIGHPIAGDVKYGAKDRLPRLALHAHSIVLTHPHSKERLTVEAPLPEIFRKLVGEIREVESGHKS